MRSHAWGKDKRKSIRRPTLMPAYVLDPHLGVVADCSVRDFFRGGAKIVVNRPLSLPSVFWLKIKGDGTLRYCTAKWRSQQQVGVEFTRDKLPQIAEDEVSELRRLMSWADQDSKTG